MWQLVFYFSFVLYYAVFGLLIIFCFSSVGCLTGCVLRVASVSVVLLCCDLTITDSRVKVWRLHKYLSPQ